MPPFYKPYQVTTPPVDQATPGGPLIKYKNLWHDFLQTMTTIKGRSFSKRSNKWESQYGTKYFVGPWGYSRDIIMAIGSWEIPSGIRDSERGKFDRGKKTYLPWVENDLQPFSGQCKDAHYYYWFAYCDANKDEECFNDIN